MAAEELHGMDKARMEGTGPPHSGRAHAPLPGELWQKPRPHQVVRGIEGSGAIVVAVVVLVVRMLEELVVLVMVLDQQIW